MATYTRFSSDDVVITTEKVFTSTWTGNNNELDPAANHFGYPGNTALATTSSPSASGEFYQLLYNGEASLTTTDPQCSIAYGNKVGSGSKNFTTGDPGFSPSRSVYGQYRSLVYGDENRNFTFNGYEPLDIIVINIDRARLKQSLRLGSLNIDLGSNAGMNFTDDSTTRSGSAVLTNIGRQYNIVSGSNGVMAGTNLSQTDSGSFGLFYPDAGIMIFNPDALVSKNIGSYNLPTRTNNSTAKDNIDGFTAAMANSSNKFELDSEEKISSQFYFVRAKNKEFNYTTNPSFIDANGNINFTSMVDNPVSYITTVGLYNDANELLAVAKLSQPITKDFTKEALIKVKLDY